MTSPEERLRARAELSSYIARMKKEQELRLAGETQSNTYSGHGPAFGFNASQRPVVVSKRGGANYSGGGHSYHPYQRAPPPHVAQKFKNRSVTFNKPDPSAVPSKEGEPSRLVPGAVANTHLQQSSQQQTETKTLCPALTSTGVCSRHGCRHLHDPNKQALCKRWLYKGSCPKGNFCALSHEPSPHNMPTCLHFQDGHCNNDDCRFAHIRINPAASVCEAFGRLGYCEKGDQCANFHAYECPDFSNKGVCRFGDKCQLRHVHRAARMRKTSRRSSEGPSSPSDDAEKDVVDIPETEEWFLNSKNSASHTPHQFTQQMDFVPLDADE
ncbi:hypothetical protein P153DRAFT_284284 [Dothidotthia symphoricarpi CBS 119687]|uniref:C3H1-type domain-containing protein n=1 Tax=Dothidotthia symphoricarpi CBS 119687 TaxID=1392245 RepID=A0A6A6AN21_9PLEO|nr:uncharacterized protein P153DRAFT_284284 [Dothidotthia symphoricarpi CBS 119687]KAF2132583.1 hypothetical protein P153DRAFT_284284 [Dothidotthia symphoricarpi CBS 119687]